MDIRALLSQIVKRTGNLLVKPADEWQIISREHSPRHKIIARYALPYIIAIAAANFLGSLIFSPFGFSFLYLLLDTVSAFAIPFAMIHIAAFIINMLSGIFNSKKDIDSAFNLVIYAFTASWLSLILSGLFPGLHVVIFIAGLYWIYIFWTGISIMMDTPESHKISYVIVAVLIILCCEIILSIISRSVIGLTNTWLNFAIGF